MSGTGQGNPGHRQRRGTRAERHIAIAEMVFEAGSLGIQDVAQRFGVSRMTVYRDVTDLEAAGVLQVRRGNLVARSSSFTETTHAFRVSLHAEEKQELCVEACKDLRPGATIMLDDSSTLVPLVPLLAEIAPLTVITHSLAIARAVAQFPDLRLHLAGGTYRPTFESFAGESTLRTLRDLSADVAVMSSTAISGGVLLHPSEENAVVKRAMLERSERRILLVDSSKFGVRATHRVATVTEFDRVVISGDIPSSERDALTDVDVTWLGA